MAAAWGGDLVIVANAEVVGLGELLFHKHLSGTKPSNKRVMALEPVEGVDVGQLPRVNADQQVVGAVRLLPVDLELVEQLRDDGVHAVDVGDLVLGPVSAGA